MVKHNERSNDRPLLPNRGKRINLNKEIRDGLLSDFTLIHRKTPYRLHRGILSRSSGLFAKLFQDKPLLDEFDLGTLPVRETWVLEKFIDGWYGTGTWVSVCVGRHGAELRPYFALADFFDCDLPRIFFHKNSYLLAGFNGFFFPEENRIEIEWRHSWDRSSRENFILGRHDLGCFPNEADLTEEGKKRRPMGSRMQEIRKTLNILIKGNSQDRDNRDQGIPDLIDHLNIFTLTRSLSSEKEAPTFDLTVLQVNNQTIPIESTSLTGTSKKVDLRRAIETLLNRDVVESLKSRCPDVGIST